MRILEYRKIDAFTVGGSNGNPAGIVHLYKDETLTATGM